MKKPWYLFLIPKAVKDYFFEQWFAEKDKAESNPYKMLCHSSFWLTLNANDFFNYACADCVELSEEDLSWAIPIIKKYKGTGVNAVMSYVRKQEPIKPWQTPLFLEAMKELNELNPKVYSE